MIFFNSNGPGSGKTALAQMALEARLVATNQLLDAALKILGLGDLASSEFTAEELKNAGGFVPAYLCRRGAVHHLNLQIVPAKIDAGDGGDGGRIHPALFGTVHAVPVGVVNPDESGEGIFCSHEEQAAEPAAPSQEP